MFEESVFGKFDLRKQTPSSNTQSSQLTLRGLQERYTILVGRVRERWCLSKGLESMRLTRVVLHRVFVFRFVVNSEIVV